jgi:upstream activation factor subunit UAF30
MPLEARMAKTSESPKEAPKRKPNAALLKPVQPDAVLAAIIGNEPIPRSQITKKLWEYIKAHKLQEKTNINADATLLPFFGGKKQATMFELPKFVSLHVIK